MLSNTFNEDNFTFISLVSHIIGKYAVSFFCSVLLSLHSGMLLYRTFILFSVVEFFHQGFILHLCLDFTCQTTLLYRAQQCSEVYFVCKCNASPQIKNLCEPFSQPRRHYPELLIFIHRLTNRIANLELHIYVRKMEHVVST